MRRRRVPLAFTPPPHWWPDLFRAWEIAATAPGVIALRTTRMAAAAARPGHRDRGEWNRMVTEKYLAAGAAWSAMALEMWLYPLRVAAAMARGAPNGMVTLPLPRTLGGALTPIRRRVRANARRLAQGRSRR